MTSVYARSEGGAIHYRVVDEYGGDTLQGPAEAKTVAPMTLGEFADFYPQFDLLCRRRVRAHFPAPEEGDD